MERHIAFENDLCGKSVDNFAAFFPVQFRFKQSAFRSNGGKPFVKKIVFALPTVQYNGGKGTNLFGSKAVASIHIARHSEHNAAGGIAFRTFANVFPVLFIVSGTVLGFDALRGDSERIADGKPDALVADVNCKIAICHSVSLRI